MILVYAWVVHRIIIILETLKEAIPQNILKRFGASRLIGRQCAHLLLCCIQYQYWNNVDGNMSRVILRHLARDLFQRRTNSLCLYYISLREEEFLGKVTQNSIQGQLCPLAESVVSKQE